MILGAGWAFLGLVVVGLAMLVLVPGCGLVVVNESPAGEVDLAAPALVEADPVVEARTASVAAMSLARVRRQARSTALRIRNVGCDRVRAGSGFALDSKLLLAGRDVVPGAGALRISSRKSAARAVGASRVYRLGDLVVARVAGRLPRRGAAVTRAHSGASVAVVGYPLSRAPRLFPGVVVDSVAGAPFGVRGPVLRLTSDLRIKTIRIVGSDAALERFRRAFPDIGGALSELKDAPFPPDRAADRCSGSCGTSDRPAAVGHRGAST